MVLGLQRAQKTARQASQAASPQTNPNGAHDVRRNCNNLDIVFLQDTTGSQGPYIKAATQAIRNICDKIAAASEISKDKIRFGLIAFRDHPPQDTSYVTKPFGFTSDIAVMQKNLSGLVATGGGDGPEAQTAALAAALDLDWAEGAIKMVVLITDSPPHGLGEAGDGFPEPPDQNDPLDIARQMSEKGITLFVIACEPALSRWSHAVDFYTALARITSGHILPLLMADKLGDFIVGTALETIETEKLIKEFEQTIVKDVYENGTPMRQVVNDLQGYIQSQGIQLNRVVMDNVYEATSVTERNVTTWLTSKDVKSGSSNVTPVIEPRLKTDYGMDKFVTPPGAVEPYPKTKHRGGSEARNKVRRLGSVLRFWRSEKQEKPATGDEQIVSSGSCPSTVPPAPRLPNFQPSSVSSIVQAPISSTQAHRIVMQSLARSSNVTEDGMSSRLTGTPISSPQIYYHG